MIYVLLPAYNEEEVLRTLIPALDVVLKKLSESYQIVVVNDGSRDKTSQLVTQLAGEMPVREVKHDRNQGYGAALKSGYLAILNSNSSSDAVVVSLDADGTHDPLYIPKLISKVREGCDMVTASYMMPGGSFTGIPKYRAFFSHAVNWLFRWFCAVPGAKTYSNGFRAYSLAILKKVKDRFGEKLIEETGFAGGAELFLKAAACGGRAGEIPFALHYERRGKESKIRFIPTILGYLKLIMRMRRHSSYPP